MFPRVQQAATRDPFWGRSTGGGLETSQVETKYWPTSQQRQLRAEHLLCLCCLNSGVGCCCLNRNGVVVIHCLTIWFIEEGRPVWLSPPIISAADPHNFLFLMWCWVLFLDLITHCWTLPDPRQATPRIPPSDNLQLQTFNITSTWIQFN